MSRTLGEIRQYLRTVLEIDDLTDTEADEHIRHAHRRVIDAEDWPFLLSRRELNLAHTAGNLPVYPVLGGRIRRVQSVFAVDATGRETRQLGYTPHNDALAAGGWTLQASSEQTAWSYQHQPFKDSALNAPDGLIYLWPAVSNPLVKISISAILEVDPWPNVLTSDGDVPSASGDRLTAGLVTAIEYLAMSETAAQLSDKSTVATFRELGLDQIEVERNNVFPTANVPIQLGGLSTGRRGRNRRGSTRFRVN